MSDEKSTPARATDLQGAELHIGDTVTLDAIVINNTDAATVELQVGERRFSLPPGVTTRKLVSRIGAAPQQRIRTVEIPSPHGGVIPVREDSREAQEYLKTGVAPSKEPVPLEVPTAPLVVQQKQAAAEAVKPATSAPAKQ